MKNTHYKKKLQWYGAIASSFLLAQKADAQIIYTDINPDAVLGAGHPGYWEYFLDLNNDGAYEYQFTQTNFGGIVVSQGLSGFSSSGDYFGYFAGGMFPKAVESGASIPGNLNFTSFAYFLYTYSSGDFTVRLNPFYDKYIPLELLSSNNDKYYGWVRMSLTGPQVIIKDYAINTTPNQPIVAGDKGDPMDCIDNLEPNNTKAVAKKMSANAEAHGLIDPAGDVDWFRFKVLGSAPNVRIILFDLPGNYNLRLNNSAGVQIATSNHKGTTNDTILMNGLANGNYYVKIVGNNGAFNAADCYSLLVQASSNPFKELMLPDVNDPVTLFPNPAHDRLTVAGLNLTNEKQEIEMLDVFGRQMKTFIVPQQTGTLNIDVDGLATGIYFLRIRMNGGIILKKVVIE